MSFETPYDPPPSRRRSASVPRLRRSSSISSPAPPIAPRSQSPANLSDTDFESSKSHSDDETPAGAAKTPLVQPYSDQGPDPRDEEEDRKAQRPGRMSKGWEKPGEVHSDDMEDFLAQVRASIPELRRKRPDPAFPALRVDALDRRARERRRRYCQPPQQVCKDLSARGRQQRLDQGGPRCARLAHDQDGQDDPLPRDVAHGTPCTQQAAQKARQIWSGPLPARGVCRDSLSGRFGKAGALLAAPLSFPNLADQILWNRTLRMLWSKFEKERGRSKSGAFEQSTAEPSLIAPIRRRERTRLWMAKHIRS